VVTVKRIGPYQLREKLGEGGMGQVYACSRPGDQRVFAVKLLPGRLIEDEGERRNFMRECEVLAKLKHPHILAVLDYGVAGNLPYLVTELCVDARGQPCSLAALQSRRISHRVEAHVVVTVFPQVCWALSFIHQQGLVHRDVKPENVLVQEDARGNVSARLADFGLAKMTADGAFRRREAWREGGEAKGSADEWQPDFSGTYDYMSPEQLAGEPVDARTDVYAFGVMLYRAATGYDRLFFQKPTEVVADLPGWVDDLVVRSAVRDKDRRCPDALELLYSLPQNLRPGDVSRAAGQTRPRVKLPEFTYQTGLQSKPRLPR